MKDKAIGVFDSGIGGLSVVQQLKKQLPRESVIYFGDTLHLPYGDKSARNICQYSTQITRFLIQQEVKLVIIACHTASVLAYDSLQSQYAQTPVFNMVAPTVQAVISNTSVKKIGIIGTPNTIQSNIYTRIFSLKLPEKQVYVLSTPLLAPMIEHESDEVLYRSVIAYYLNQPVLQDIDALVLACTHYPHIKKDIQTHYARKQKKVQIIDPSFFLARQVKTYLQQHNALHFGTAQDVFFVSEYNNNTHLTTLFMDQPVVWQEKNLWAE